MDPVDPRQALALARFQAISAFLADDPPRGQRAARLAHLAGKAWPGPEDTTLRVSAETLRVWVRRYKKGGFAALFDKERDRKSVV